MSREIVIDIENINTARKYATKAFFQKEALDIVMSILSERCVKSKGNIVDCRFHDTIFVDGARGVGKTAFMLNIESYYNKKKNKQKTYLFLDPVDPTLLEHTEKFLSIVLARVVERVSTEEKEGKITLEREYFEALAKLSKSLSAIKTISDDVGIEEIASNQSSLQLEQNAHSFFKIVSETFKVEAIVVLIDDIDMAFDKGFDVLEVVRKYLASPYIIPIVAGDMKLYREIIETQFMSKIDYKNDLEGYKVTKDIFEGRCEESKNSVIWDNTTVVCDKQILQSNRATLLEKRRLVNNLVMQYINKVFPNEYHIKLEDMFSILKANNIKIKISKDITIPYTELKEFEVRHINFGINPETYKYPVFENNTRSFMQYLYKKKDVYQKFFDSTEIKKQEEEQESEEGKTLDGENKSEKLDNKIIEKLFNENAKRYKESIQKTAVFYQYAEEPKQRELSQILFNDVYAYENGKYNIYNAFKGAFFKHSKLDPEKENETYAVHYKSYPKLKSVMDKYIVDLFVFNNYYKNDATKNYMFSGKFIEMLVYSLSLHLMPMNTKIHQENFQEITNTVPFNSVFLYNKRYEKNKDTLDELEDDTDESNIDYNEKELKKIVLEIEKWNKDYITDIKLNSLSLYEILHKFFNNLNHLKMVNIRNMKPLEYMQRVVIIFINAVAFFENTNKRVAETNIALTKSFNLGSALQQSLAWKRNIKPMKGEKGSLTQILYEHPIIKYILNDNENNLLSLRFVVVDSRTKAQIKKDLLNTFDNIYKKYYRSFQSLKESKEEKDYINEIKNEINKLTDRERKIFNEALTDKQAGVAYRKIKEFNEIKI